MIENTTDYNKGQYMRKMGAILKSSEKPKKAKKSQFFAVLILTFCCPELKPLFLGYKLGWSKVDIKTLEFSFGRFFVSTCALGGQNNYA